MIVLDTSVVVDAFCGSQPALPALRATLERGHRLLMPALVLYEWLRGPRLAEELVLQEALFPREGTMMFGPAEAAMAARLYSEVPKARGREFDLAIAAMALEQSARLWTLNRSDFDDIPALELYEPPA